MAEELPIKYVKDKDGKFMPITSPNAVINEDGKNINELYVSYESGVEVEPQINELLEKIYPIGSIYISTNGISPAEFLGGTWLPVEDRFLLGKGSSYALGNKGGEATHTLTKSEIPSNSVAMFSGAGSKEWQTPFGNNSNGVYTYSENMTGGGDQPHNNMPPYQVVAMYERIG